jgi:hypothetical protein
MNDNIDVKENSIYKLDGRLLDILLMDRSSKKNLIWATDNYASKGFGYQEYDHITVNAIIKRNGNVIKPRVEKSKKEQAERVKSKAEVFTPSWVCNCQNNLVDNAWFGRKNVFNIETEKGWNVSLEKITFPKGKTWQDYVEEKRLEITCGEAPYLVSRYDTVSGAEIAIKERIGLLDRKLRIVSENVDDEKEWVEWAKTAFKSVYGFDWQGDNVLLARENLLRTFIDYYTDKFGLFPITEYLFEIAEIVSWNIWQMDGLKYVIPNSCKPLPKLQMSFFEDEEECEECPGCAKNDNSKHTGIYCVIKDWENGKNRKFVTLVRGI